MVSSDTSGFAYEIHVTIFNQEILVSSMDDINPLCGGLYFGAIHDHQLVVSWGRFQQVKRRWSLQARKSLHIEYLYNSISPELMIYAFTVEIL